MTSTIPQPSRPTTTPPTSALPPLPTPKYKTSQILNSSTPRSQSPIASKLRTPSSPVKSSARSAIPNTNLASSSINNAYKRSPSLGHTPGSPEKSVRRTVSIAAFPQPPKASSRPSLNSAASLSSIPSSASKSRPSEPTTPTTPARTLRKKKTPRLDTGQASKLSQSTTPSLLNGSGDGKSIPSSRSVRNSEGQSSVVSPTPSRSSSTQGSCSTSATTYDDGDDGHTARDSTGDISASSRRNSKTKGPKGNVLVNVRVRPDLGSSDPSKSEGEWLVDGRSALVSYRGREGGDYFYDNVFTTHDNNAKVYDSSAKRLVRRVMEGYHGTVFAYGMTGTGKTFSMQGTATSPGVIPLAITDIFSYIRETPHREFLLRVSYLEIYNEKIHDLLSAPAPGSAGAGAPQQEEIKLREDSKRGVYATPLKEEIVQSPTQLLRVIARGDHARRTGSTQFNARSSRSHAVVQIVVESRERTPTGSSQEKRSGIVPGGVRVSTLSLIDLAGSERAAENKERRTEGAHINKSLLTLGTVIARLTVDKEKQSGGGGEKEGKHLPYRDSKLTRLLQPALSGNSLVSILCTIQIGSGGSAAGANSHVGETMNTLKFAARAKNNIVSNAKKAEESYGSGGGDAGSRVLLERYRMEIQSLRTQLESQAKKAKEDELLLDKAEEKQQAKDAEDRHEEQMLEMQLARTALKERIEHLNRLILCSKSTGVNANLIGFAQMGFGDPTRSLRSSASQSTLGASSLNRSTSLTSIRTSSTAPGGQIMPMAPLGSNGEDEDTIGEFADGIASMQMQINALQADLTDKNRYISTLERRLLQARRSSHSRVSMGLNHKPSGGNSPSDPDIAATLREKDLEIADLRLQLDDKDRMVTALRSSVRQRDLAQITGGATSRSDAAPTPPPSHPPPPVGSDVRYIPNHKATESNSSSLSGGPVLGPVSPVTLLSPVKLAEKEKEKKRKSVDEMSRMLDEMIQDRVENGHIVRSKRGSVRITSSGSVSTPTPTPAPALTNGNSIPNNHPVTNGVSRPQRKISAESNPNTPGLGALVGSTLRESVAEVES